MNNNRHFARLYNYRREEAKSIARAKQIREKKKTEELIESSKEYIENNNKKLAKALKATEEKENWYAEHNNSNA